MRVKYRALWPISNGSKADSPALGYIQTGDRRICSVLVSVHSSWLAPKRYGRFGSIVFYEAETGRAQRIIAAKADAKGTVSNFFIHHL